LTGAALSKRHGAFGVAKQRKAGGSLFLSGRANSLSA